MAHRSPRGVSEAPVGVQRTAGAKAPVHTHRLAAGEATEDVMAYTKYVDDHETEFELTPAGLLIHTPGVQDSKQIIVCRYNIKKFVEWLNSERTNSRLCGGGSDV